MALISCPECKKEISDSAVMCPHCGYSNKALNNSVVPNDFSNINQNGNKKRFPTEFFVAGVIIFVITTILIFRPVSSSSQNNTNKSSQRSNYSSYSSQTSKYSESDMAFYEKRNKDLEMKVTSVYSNKYYTVCEGTITNKGTDRYKFIKIKGSFMDKKGNVVDTDWTYGIGSEGLSGGEETKFRLSVDVDESITDCKLTYVVD